MLQKYTSFIGYGCAQSIGWSRKAWGSGTYEFRHYVVSNTKYNWYIGYCCSESWGMDI